MSNVVTRFAPSPTGLKHAGNYRTAVFCYLFAKQHDGSSLVRIEDTDGARSKPEYEQNIFDTLTWLGLMPNEKPIRSSDRIERHKELLQKLVSEDKAYVSLELKKDDTTKTIEVVRLRNPQMKITFHDEIRGDITFDTTEHGDFVIARAMDDPLYHFAVVVDDADMNVTHVIRGEDHISNTPRHVLIQEALGLPHPIYAHVPLLLNTNRTKLSTRTGAKPLYEYREIGILPEAIINYLALLGWNPGDDREYMSREELIEAFDLSRIQKGGAVFDEVKLFSVNQYWMRKLSDKDFLSNLKVDCPASVIALLKERARTFKEAREMLSGELRCLFTGPVLERDRLLSKELPDRQGLALSALKDFIELINALTDSVSAMTIKNSLMPLANAEEEKGKGGRGAVLWPLRYALSGQDSSPDPFTLISILGKSESISRIRRAIDILEG